METKAAKGFSRKDGKAEGQEAEEESGAQVLQRTHHKSNDINGLESPSRPVLIRLVKIYPLPHTAQRSIRNPSF